MNRRGFFSRLALATAAFTILPSATTYSRIWKPTTGIFVPEFEMPFNAREFAGTWKFIKFEKSVPLIAKRAFQSECVELVALPNTIGKLVVQYR